VSSTDSYYLSEFNKNAGPMTEGGTLSNQMTVFNNNSVGLLNAVCQSMMTAS